MLALLDGLHVLGFATASERSREQLLRNVSLMGAAPAAGMSALTALTLAFAYAAPDPSTGLEPDLAGVRVPRAAARGRGRRRAARDVHARPATSTATWSSSARAPAAA